jgi:hypothetical protein
MIRPANRGDSPQARSAPSHRRRSTLVATDLGPVDVLQGLPQIPPFRQLYAEAVGLDLGGTIVRVCSLEGLLAMKRASDRSRDRDDLEALEAAHASEDEPDD